MTPLAVRSYRTLIRWLPASVRDAYGDEMLALFTEQWSAARQIGRLPALAVWGRSVWDALRQVPREHWIVAGRYSHEESMHTFLSDLRFAARSFSRQRGATLLVLLTLTLAVAANTGVFLLLDDLFFRPFPFRDPASLVYLNERAPKWNLEFTGVNFPDFDGWRKRTHSFDALGLIATGNFNLAIDGAAERVQGANVTWDLPRALGIRPILGRAFTAADDRPNGPNVVMIGSGFWRTRFGGARDVVGKTIRLDSAPFTVIGVLPDAAEFPGGVQLWTPLNGDTGQKYTSYAYEGIGRLKPGVTIEAARADLLAAQEPIWRERDTAHVVSPRIMPLREWFVAEYRTTGQVLGLGVVLVLLIACANVAGAMLARTSFRKRELAIRAALGASARRIARQMLTEALLLATIAGVAGTAAGWWGIRALLFASPDQLPPWVHLEFSWRIAGFSMAIIAIVTALFGAGPAIDARRQGVRAALAAGDLRTSASPGQRRMLSALVVAEVALATVLLVSGGLLVRAYANLKAVDPGFRADGVAEFRLALPQAKYDDGRKERQLYDAVIERLSAIPGVAAAGGVSCLPFTCHWGNFYTAEGSALKPGGQNPVILTRVASPGYFAAMGIQTLHGRTYLAGEQRPLGELFPVVINAEFARLHWPDVSDPVGKRIASSGSGTKPWMTVVGVVKDVRHYGLSEPMRPGIYLPMSFLDSTQSVGGLGFAVRTTGNPVAIFPAIRSVLHEIDPELPVYQLRTLQDALDASLMGRRSLMIVLAAFAAIALTLALGGIYAILSYVVGRRRREIGIRMALGAQRGQVIRMVVLQGARLMSAGLLIGLPLAFASTRILTSLLVGVSAGDPLTYVVVTALLGVTSVVAAFAPARRAASVNPTSVLADGG